ncbi:hypothetical protein [Alicycliphilus denitrificans]|uniref:hypothetical protein n=1 Tax=Alicycliphilus denitrificans TaxID=179636 RepID=UPI0001D9EDEB|nr:hypothetical protein [Alicycliphilus denitrificans]ADU99802.1 hypothetical protein Alide_2059 [Alicycliphilus denitrificans BC]
MDHFDTPAPPAHTVKAPTAAERFAEAELALSYDLAKRVPAMERGFTISTSYGDIVIPPGHHANGIAAAVRRALEIQLKATALARRDAELDGGHP